MNQDLKIESQESTKTSALNSLRHQKMNCSTIMEPKKSMGFFKIGISLFKLADFQGNPPSRTEEPQERSIDFSQAIPASRPHLGQKVGHVVPSDERVMDVVDI